MKPKFWQLIVDGAVIREYSQRAAANGAAIVLRAQGRPVVVKPVF